MLSNELRAYQPGELSRHPWQDNVPDLVGKEWQDFIDDIRQRGIMEPIRVSTRLGYPVIVDGHQRHRAALELDLPEIQAFVQPFETEAQEVEYLAAAAQMRRHLSDFQRVTLARAYEAYFRPMAEEREKAGKTLESNDARVPAHERKSSTQAAKAAGLSEPTYRRGKAVQDKAPEPVKQAWAKEEISTNAAYSLTRAPDPITEAIERGEIDVHQGLRVERNKELSKDVAEGRKTVAEAVSIADMMKREKEQREAEMGEKEAYAMQSTLQKIMDLDVDDYLFVLQSRHNKEVWSSSFSSDWQEAIRHMRAIAQAAEGRMVESQTKTITLEALN